MDLTPSTLQRLIAAVNGLPYLCLRLRFAARDGTDLGYVDSQVWRGALKNHLPPTVMQQLFEPADPARGHGGRSRPPGLVLAAASALELSFFGTAALHALDVVQALAAGAWAGLGDARRVGVLTSLSVANDDAAWLDVPMALTAQELSRHAMPLESSVGNSPCLPAAAAEPCARTFAVALHFLTPCVLPNALVADAAPDLNVLLRSLLPRMFDLAMVWRAEAPAALQNAELQGVIDALPTWPAAADGRAVRRHSARVVSKKKGAEYDSSGFRGLLLFESVPQDIVALLRLGQRMGIGQQVTLGRGRYELLVGPVRAERVGHVGAAQAFVVR